MHEFSLDFLRCVRCSSKLDLDVFKKENEIEEGILECKKCSLSFPIINKIPILWDDFSKYLSERIMLGGKLFNSASDEKMKKFLKHSLSNCIRKTDDRTLLEDRWSKIYQNSQKSKFYSNIKNELDALPKSKLVLEYGCSIGTMSNYLADTNQIVFGIDRSFSALSMAKKTSKDNLDYFVADFLSNVFGKTKFDLILALNVLELIEPIDYLKKVSEQIHAGTFVISDPYDFDRGKNSVKKFLDESTLRSNLERLMFSITKKTKKPSFITWNLKLNSRSTLTYKVDLIVAKKLLQ
ncbi:methyltransferase domain-containing protein [Nitrosarchaeum sp. AC2]|uniref:methyltransferase domain-containing protein n=1 Tax=Nitrosarchaeum sp. AC2 TaxID=2259673 RepID=UPI0015C91E53|nr:methyltransferase domain-containing protein [Nitrosarchaeum sp. AC2]QLH11915.1 methyltransferase type 11 [Nitrosarchaeum sp. AC2]